MDTLSWINLQNKPTFNELKQIIEIFFINNRENSIVFGHYFTYMNYNWRFFKFENEILLNASDYNNQYGYVAIIKDSYIIITCPYNRIFRRVYKLLNHILFDYILTTTSKAHINTIRQTLYKHPRNAEYIDTYGNIKMEIKFDVPISQSYLATFFS